jgi:ABC-type multidrug transport system ATPase subunit
MTTAALRASDRTRPTRTRSRLRRDRSAASRKLIVELVTFLNQRQSAIVAEVNRQTARADARADAAELRHARTLDHLERIQHRVARLSSSVDRLKRVVEALRPTAPLPLRPVAPAAHGNVLLRIEKLAKEIGGSDILRDISFDIHEHEILGLIGPNGAGKTTLIECLANLRPRTAGTFYEGEEAPPTWDPTRLMFYLPNGVAPYGELYTIQVLTLFGRLFEVEPRRWERIIIDDLALGPVLQKKVGALSKGNLQRMLIALALMSPQPLLALDEPFDGLDLHQTQAMMDILRNLRASRRTLLLCIHQLTDAERICDRLLLLSGGRLVAIGTLDELRAQAGLPDASLEAIFLALTTRPSTIG